ESSAQVNVELKAMPYVMINSEPSGAEVMINGNSIGVTPVEQLIEKETVVELSKEGFITQTATLTGTDKQVSLTLEAVPVLITNAVAEVTAPVETPVIEEPVSNGMSPLIWAGIAVVVAALIAIILVKRNKK
ncbi:MAG: PEGA domain-containing protein, partial [Kiritimatiellales bacterium]|nr:PEGA domain-containing protein [Kiritimatiellales bacterium]